MKESKFASHGKFQGIPDAKSFFEWATKLTNYLLGIHQAQVVHGDIWPDNIMVDSHNNPVLIDFGQSLYRDISIIGIDRRSGTNLRRTNRLYIPPEHRNSVAADIYSLGGVLFYLATGEDPPPRGGEGIDELKNIDDLKDTIVEVLKRTNTGLYEENCGVADIIARCLRYSEHERIPHAESVLQDIETFSGTGPFKDDTETISLSSLKGTGINPLFAWMSRLRIRLSKRIFEDMERGVYDLTGDHEDIVNGLTQYLSFLEKGDQYLTVSLPSFWREKNLGINGRFLAMNKLAAQRGATIRRILMITRKEMAKDSELKKIIKSHKRILTDLKKFRKDNPKIKVGEYYTGFIIMKPKEREKLIQDGKHFGIMVKGDQQMLIAPIQNDKGVVVTIRFRAHSSLVPGLLDYFKQVLHESQPLSKYKIR